MRKLLYCLGLLLLTCCSIGSKNPKTIITNLYKSSSTDSINQVLRTENVAIRIASTENAEIDTLYIGKYVVIEERIGYCFWAITDAPDYYWIDVPEYLVGYSIGFLYDKTHSTLYQTDPFDLNNEGYQVLYETCNFDGNTIEVKYVDKSIGKIPFSKCPSDTIRL